MYSYIQAHGLLQYTYNQYIVSIINQWEMEHTSVTFIKIRYNKKNIKTCIFFYTYWCFYRLYAILVLYCIHALQILLFHITCCMFFVACSIALKIQVSGATADLLHTLGGYVLTCRGTLNVKVTLPHSSECTCTFISFMWPILKNIEELSHHFLCFFFQKPMQW